ncbi:hypothetical protein ES705_09912 [subsurface metagenome]
MEFLGFIPKKKERVSAPVLLTGADTYCKHGKNLIFSITDNGPWDVIAGIRDFSQIKIIPLIQEDSKTKIAIKIIDEIVKLSAKYPKARLKDLFLLDDVSYDNLYYFNKKNLKELIDEILSSYLIREKIEPFPIVFSTDHKNISPTEIYYETKKTFLNEGYPTQHISINPISNTLLNFNTRFWPFTARNLQLQVYMKSSGIPWILDTRSTTPSISFGIGQARRLSPNKGFAFGTVALFESNGRWGYMDSTPDFPIPHKSKALAIPKEYIEDIFRRVLIHYERIKSVIKPWISIHKMGRFSDEEVEGILNIMNERNYQCELLEITKTRIRLAKKQNNNIFPIDQFTWIPLTSYRGLLVNTGSGVTKIGTPVVLKLNRHRDSTINSKILIKESAQNIADLTFMGWRSFFAEGYQLPATLDMATKAAKLLNNGVNPADRLKTRPWFG